jgi:hypothetical protein
MYTITFTPDFVIDPVTVINNLSKLSMQSPDYHTVMEERIKYFRAKYDPLNKFGIEMETIEDLVIHEPEPKPDLTFRKPNRILQVVHSFLALFF